jgi:RNA polymerase sigma factor (sigma-70 family)
MVSNRQSSLARGLSVLFSLGAAGDLADGELLELFTARGGEAAELAFGILVERHGPMVLRVCRQVLRDGHAAEDALQATFFVLARRARSLRVGQTLAPWLQQVAWRTASRLRGRIARRRFHERKAAERMSCIAAENGHDDVGAVLQEELGRLAPRFRVPLVLCYLEGLTAEQAARQLGWPSGTVRSRLARGRERLRARLVRRGVAPSAAALAAALTSGDAWAALPAKLAAATTQCATLLAQGRVGAGSVPASILTLTEGVLQAMAMTKLKMAATVLAVGLATTALALGQGPPGGGGRQADGQPGADRARGGADHPSAGGAPAAADSSSARLREVERKLDRILDALGANRSEERSKDDTAVILRGRLFRGAPKDAADPDTTKKATDPAGARALLNLDRDNTELAADALPALAREERLKDEAGAQKPTTAAAQQSQRYARTAAAEEMLRRARADYGSFGPADRNSIEPRLALVEKTLAELAERVKRLENNASRPAGNDTRLRDALEEQRSVP